MSICALGAFLLQRAKPQIHFPLLHAPISKRHPRARRQRAAAICECISLVTRGTAKGSGLGASDLQPEPPQCTCRHFCLRTEAPTPFPLATDSGPRWRCREAAWGAGGHGPGQLRLRDSHGVNSLLHPARWKYVQKMRATCPQLLHLVSLQSAAN